MRARLTLAALLAVLLGGLIAGPLLLAAVERDGRRAVDQELQEQTSAVLRGPPGEGRFGRGPRGGQPLLRGSGSFVQVTVGDEVVAQDGDVPDSVPAPPEREGYSTVEIEGTHWRSLTVPLGGGHNMERSEERPERRTNHRLRMLIDDLQSQLRDTRHAVEYIRESVAELRLSVEELRRAFTSGR